MMNITTIDVFGFEGAFKGMRNPLDSWSRSDSNIIDGKFNIGNKDMELAQKLIQGGAEHSKFMRMIHVQADINMPRYWWAEADCYKFSTRNSCSTMHTIMKKEITIDDFEVPTMVKDILHRKDKEKRKFDFVCNLPKETKLSSKIIDINGYEYEVFNNGEIYSLPKDVTDNIGRVRHYDRKLLTIGQNKGEYFSVRLGGRNGRSYCVHKLLAELFIPNDNPTQKTVVNHIDGNKGNCSLDNLEWCTYSENNKHAFDNGLKEVSLYAKYKAYILNRKLDSFDIKRIREMLEQGYSTNEIAKYFDVSQSQICTISTKGVNELIDEFEEAYVYETVINRLNELRQLYLETNDYNYVIRMKKLLPESFLQLRTFDTNYAELRNMYRQRCRHRLTEEWVDTFCKWVESLPYANELILYGIK